MAWGLPDRKGRNAGSPKIETFEEAVLPHLDAAHNLARWLARDAAAAEDIVQDAMLRSLNYFHSFRGDNARAWLLRIVRNTAHDTLAARARQATVSLDSGFGSEEAEEPAALQVPDDADDPEAALDRRQGMARLEAMLAGLPLELRECVVLRELEELSYKDIAAVTGVPIGTVMSRLWRARQALIQTCAGEA